MTTEDQLDIANMSTVGEPSVLEQKVHVLLYTHGHLIQHIREP